MTNLPRANWNYPTAIRFGAGRVAELAELAASLGLMRPLLVTDPALAQMDMVGEALDRLPEAGLFSEIHANPVGGDVEAGLEL